MRWFVCAVFAAYLFVGFPFNEVAGHETYAFLAVAFLATVLAGNSRPALVGCLLAFAATFRPDAILFAPILVSLDWGRSQSVWRMYFTSRSFWRFCFGFIIIIVPWLIYLWIHFGQLIPGTMDAKRAQVALGYWPLYTPKTLLMYIVVRLGLAALLVMSVGLLVACVWITMRMRVLNALLQRGIFIATTWLLFCSGSVCAYFLFNVTFWFWYGVPVLFSFGVASFVGWRIVIDQFNNFSKSLSHDKRLAHFLRVAPIIVIGLLTLSEAEKFIDWCKNNNVNAHIHAYTEIADYLKRVEPAGATIQMFEPGSFGFGLGSKFKIIDELGLITPGVAKAMLRGDSDYADRTYHAKYLVCAWPGSFSTCAKPALSNFELVGEFNVDFWRPMIGHGARLYRRIGI